MNYRNGKQMLKRALRLGIAVFVLFSMVIGVWAAPSETVSARIPVNQKVAGTQKPSTAVRFRIEAEEKGIPMPAEQEIAAEDTGGGVFEIPYTEPGTYRYRVSQITGGEKNWTYDKTVYSVEVYVLWNDTMTALTPHVICYNEAGEKTDLTFQNGYQGPRAQTIRQLVKTGDQSGAGVWMAAAVASCAAVLGLYAKRKSQKE